MEEMKSSATEGPSLAGKRGTFTGSFGFVLAAAGSAIGLGNLWRFPYLAAKDGGGLFLLVYLVLVLTFGFALLTTEVTLGRKTRQGPLTAYGKINKRWGFLGVLACLVPVIILPYYCAIGGWVLKYLATFLTFGGADAAQDGFFTGHITSFAEPIVWMIVFLGVSAVVVYRGVNKGIETTSRILMPILLVLIVGISIFALTLSYTDAQGVTRTGLEGLAVYVIPDFSGITLQQFLVVLTDATGQLFFSISVAMGIMVAYGSYARSDSNLMQSINRIEFFDTLAAMLAGLMIVPAVFVFMGVEGMGAGPGLMFVSLPKVFAAMGAAGPIVGLLFFLLVTFAAITSAVSIMEAIVSSIIDKFKLSRKKSVIITAMWALIAGLIVCLGYNVFYFELTLPNGAVAQILDVMDYASNNLFMPLLALLTCILFGWVVKPKVIIDEVEQGGKFKFQRRHLYVIMMKFVCPVLLAILLLQSLGLFTL
ncbi:sodium-dependent transporter [Adlercreutzia sp. ZJ141]|uniref:sodium-dependent transporter n=1 Tax=Adlercreutzia sp. ZJ141 TaxID=2709406 RepID=UPI001F1546C6|nr:sodium-dependent transporter [Adlercreutzia sp. ZJ141]